jgi:LacI family transcriptional regulator
MSDPDRRATIRDVATRAGVSPGTVSKAINGTGQISAETRERILRVAEEIDFRPNQLARSVFERRSFTVGMITTDSFERFSVPVMIGAEDALGAGRMSVFLCDSRDDPIREKHYIDVLTGRRVDGFIVTGRNFNARPPLAVPPRTPVVYALTPSSDPDDCSIGVDDEGAGRLAGEHLVRLGRTRIAHVTGPTRFDAAVRRAAGFTSALAAGGVAPIADVYWGEWSESWGREAARMLLRRHPDLDAVYCGSDMLARGVADGLRDAGVRVPEDVAIIGTDNWEVMALGSRPTLTSVDLRLADVGRLAAERLLDAIDGRPHAGLELVPPQLVIRGSTAGGGE